MEFFRSDRESMTRFVFFNFKKCAEFEWLEYKSRIELFYAIGFVIVVAVVVYVVCTIVCDR